MHRIASGIARVIAISGLATTLLAQPTLAACQRPEFGAWLGGVRQEALAAGISPAAVSAGLNGLTFNSAVVSRDRGQGVFSQSFLQFSDRMVSGNRMQQGARHLRQQADVFRRIEAQYGVPGSIITAFWGLETDFGTNNGNFQALRSLATLAYDCRRPTLFRPQLLDALRLIERGDLTPEQMVGAWAGEIGQVQFMPSDYYRYAVDYDGDGRRNLIRSAPDALASAGNYLASLGWNRGQPWMQEVRVPSSLAWQDTGLDRPLSRAEWARRGVTLPNGSALAADSLPAALILPMGREGPAFLAYPNFNVLLKWNQSFVYVTTVAYFANRLEGAPAMRRGSGKAIHMGAKQIEELQKLLNARGFNAGKVDGLLGAGTRASTREAQIALGLPADGYPTADLLERLRRGQ